MNRARLMEEIRIISKILHSVRRKDALNFHLHEKVIELEQKIKELRIEYIRGWSLIRAKNVKLKSKLKRKRKLLQKSREQCAAAVVQSHQPRTVC